MILYLYEEDFGKNCVIFVILIQNLLDCWK